MKYEIRNRWTGDMQFTAEIECDDNAPTALKVGLAVRWAHKRDANLRDADLRDADLRGADLYDANLRDTDLRGADLYDANLRDADLRDADLRGADLRGADLRGADLRGANLRDADAARLSILPDGDLIGWKKAGGAIVKLRIPAEAKRSNATGRKCRAEYAEVLAIEGAEEAVTNGHGPRTVYRVGETVYPDQWDECRWNECSHGIHFFITREEALRW